MPPVNEGINAPMREGLIIKGSGGFYTVRDQEGREWTCRPRGKLRRQGASPVVGDRVCIDTAHGAIEKIRPRVNFLVRPPVANIDRVVLVASLRNPDPDWQLVNRQLVMDEAEGMRAMVCLNKIDLLEDTELERVRNRLKPFPYPVVYTSVFNQSSLDLLREHLQGHINVLAGPSGVGKSTLLNALHPDLEQETGAVSDRINRGRHTTRLAELFFTSNGGVVVDTPGFSRLKLQEIASRELSLYFPEIASVSGQCSFRDCLHLHEPECAIRKAEEAGGINPLRYAHYRLFLEELAEQENKMYD